MVSRLRDHIERLDDGVVHAADDIAVVLRALLCDGPGNNVMTRLFKDTKTRSPTVQLSAPPERGNDVNFSVGSFPIDELSAANDAAVTVGFARWKHEPVVTVAIGPKVTTLTWQDFLNSYANKWGGAHLDAAVPFTLQSIDLHAAAGLSLSSYLLRAAGVKVWHLAQDLVRHTLGSWLPAGTTAEQRAVDSFASEGGVNYPPRDRRTFGELQYFSHTKTSVDVIWYVDGASTENVLEMAFGKFPYTIRFQPPGTSADARAGTKRTQAPRHPDRSQPLVLDQGEVKDAETTMIIRSFVELTAAAVPATDLPDPQQGAST